MNDKVLACIDHSSYAPAVCSYAAWAALQLDAPLEFIHVLDRHPETAKKRDYSGSIGLGAQESLLEELATLDEKASRVAQESGRVMLEAARQRAIAQGIAVPEGRQRHGHLVETLAELESSARLFVLGRRGEAAENAPRHAGGNLERVARALHRPMLVVPNTFSKPQSLMIAFDGSVTTKKGVEMIASSPLFRGLPCHLVTAGSPAASVNRELEWAETTLRAAGFACHAAVVPGEPETALTSYLHTQGVDLLVMGAYGHSRIRQLLVGSTTTLMMRTVTVPLLLLH